MEKLSAGGGGEVRGVCDEANCIQMSRAKARKKENNFHFGFQFVIERCYELRNNCYFDIAGVGRW